MAQTYSSTIPAAQGPKGAQGPYAPGSAASLPTGSSASSAIIDPNVAGQQVAQRFKQKFNRDMTPDETKALYGLPGVNYTPGAQVTQSMLDTALGAIDRYTGNLADPWGTSANVQMSGAVTKAGRSWQPYTPSPPPASATYTPGQLPTTPIPTYNPMQIQPFTPNTGVNNAQNDLLMRVLESPESLSPLVVAQMKERQKEDALAYERAVGEQLAQSAASRGVLGGGAYGASQRRLAADTNKAILAGNRDIDIAAAQTNMADRLNAIAAANAVRSQGVSDYNAALAGQTAQAAENQAGYRSTVDAVNHALEVALQQEALKRAGAESALNAWNAGNAAGLDASNQALQAWLGEMGIDLDREKLAEASRQFQQNYGLDLMRVLNDMVMGRANYGLNLATLGQNAQQSMFDWLANIGRNNLG